MPHAGVNLTRSLLSKFRGHREWMAEEQGHFAPRRLDQRRDRGQGIYECPAPSEQRNVLTRVERNGQIVLELSPMEDRAVFLFFSPRFFSTKE